MGINLRNENVKDATIQVHIAFENAGRRYQRNPKSKRATRQWNNAWLRNDKPIQLTTGRNTAMHRSSTKRYANKQHTSLPRREGYQ